MKVLVTHSYFLRFDPKQWELQQPYAPLGAMYAAAVLRKNNCEVSFHDTMFSEKANEVLIPLQKNKPDWFIIYDDGSEASVYGYGIDAALEMVEKHGLEIGIEVGYINT